jgi:uncharacterized protein (DUF1810 family)
MAQRYAVRDIDQAKRYLADPILGIRVPFSEFALNGYILSLCVTKLA